MSLSVPRPPRRSRPRPLPGPTRYASRSVDERSSAGQIGYGAGHLTYATAPPSGCAVALRVVDGLDRDPDLPGNSDSPTLDRETTAMCDADGYDRCGVAEWTIRAGRAAAEESIGNDMVLNDAGHQRCRRQGAAQGNGRLLHRVVQSHADLRRGTTRSRRPRPPGGGLLRQRQRSGLGHREHGGRAACALAHYPRQGAVLPGRGLARLPPHAGAKLRRLARAVRIPAGDALRRLRACPDQRRWFQHGRRHAPGSQRRYVPARLLQARHWLRARALVHRAGRRYQCPRRRSRHEEMLLRARSQRRGRRGATRPTAARRLQRCTRARVCP